MAKMDRLRWIPMIVQAYQAAKTKMNSSLPMINIPADQVNSENSKMVSQVHQQPTRTAKKPVDKHSALLRTKKLTSSQISSTNRLIRELRSANKKLNRLETIHQQLKEMESLFAGLSKEIQQTVPEPPQSIDAKKNQAPEPNNAIGASQNYFP